MTAQGFQALITDRLAETPSVRAGGARTREV
jgi:hypothetical protein